MREKLIKIGAKVVHHGSYITFQLAEVAVSRALFADSLRLFSALRPKGVPRDVGDCMRDLEQRQQSVDLKDFILNDLSPDEPIAPKREGRVCKRGAEPCLADEWR